MQIFINYLEFINYFIQNNFLISIFIFSLFLFIYNSFSLPGNLIFFISSGFFFDLYIGYIINIVSLALGSLFFFIFSKYFFKYYFKNFFNKYSKKLNLIIKDSSYEYLILIRIIPGPPLFAQNICLSLLNISKIKFILTTVIGFSPLMFLTSLIGKEISNFMELKNYNLYNLFSIEYSLIFTIFIILIIFRIFNKKKTS